jgi:hypothetical protein
MSIIKRKYIVGLAVAMLVLWILSNAISEPGVKDLRGDFKEVGLYRNENNTGPIVRIYAVTLSDTLWSEMEQYGNFMPHTKYGNTKVYFFREGSPVPPNLSEEPFKTNPDLRKYTLASYEKDAMGNVTFQKFPFGDS